MRGILLIEYLETDNLTIMLEGAVKMNEYRKRYKIKTSVNGDIVFAAILFACYQTGRPQKWSCAFQEVFLSV